MPVYHAEIIVNKKKEDKWFTSREEAANYLSIRAAIDFLNKIPPKGLSIEGRARIVLENLDILSSRLAEIDGEIQEYTKKKD